MPLAPLSVGGFPSQKRTCPDVVEYPSDAGSAGACDVSVVTPLRDDAGFVEAWAAEPGLAARQRQDYS